MSESKQKFSASLAKDAVYQQGLRSFMEYRDLGIADATHGKMRAHIVRVKQGGDTHDLHTTGLAPARVRLPDVLRAQGHDQVRLRGPGRAHLRPRRLRAPACRTSSTTSSSAPDDLEILEIYSPAVHPTVKVEKMPEAVAATR